jgi:hypothetical protein
MKKTLPLTAIVPSSSFHYDIGNHLFFARKSDLGADFHFSPIDYPESDIGFGLQFGPGGTVFIFYLTRTLEAEGKVTGWEFRALSDYSNRLSVRISPETRVLISND